MIAARSAFEGSLPLTYVLYIHMYIQYGVPVANFFCFSIYGNHIYMYLVAIIAHAVAVRSAVEGSPLTFRGLTSPQLKMICFRNVSYVGVGAKPGV